VTLPDVRSVTFDRPQRIGPKPGGYYIARLTLNGHQLWACRHRHEKDRDARRCGYATWLVLREWLEAAERQCKGARVPLPMAAEARG
jgi:hypothetical protein